MTDLLNRRQLGLNTPTIYLSDCHSYQAVWVKACWAFIWSKKLCRQRLPLELSGGPWIKPRLRETQKVLRWVCLCLMCFGWIHPKWKRHGEWFRVCYGYHLWFVEPQRRGAAVGLAPFLSQASTSMWVWLLHAGERMRGQTRCGPVSLLLLPVFKFATTLDAVRAKIAERHLFLGSLF